MVNIKLSDWFVQNDPDCSANPNSYIFILGNDKNIIPSVERTYATVADALRNGSPFQINLIPYEDFQIEDTVFENLVQNSRGGGNTEVLNRLLYYVNVGVLEIYQDNNIGSPFTAKEILNYTAP